MAALSVTVLLVFTPMLSSLHELGHYLSANLLGGSAEIVSTSRTLVDVSPLADPFVTAAGYNTEMLIWFGILMVSMKRSKLWFMVGIIGPFFTVSSAFGSSDFSHGPMVVLVFFAHTALLFFLYFKRARKFKLAADAEKKRREESIRRQVAKEMEAKRLRVEENRRLRGLVNPKKVPYTKENELFGFTSYVRK